MYSNTKFKGVCVGESGGPGRWHGNPESIGAELSSLPDIGGACGGILRGYSTHFGYLGARWLIWEAEIPELMNRQIRFW